MLSKKEILEEYAKCLYDPIYAIETYLKTYDQTQGGKVPFELFPRQKEVIRNYEDNYYNIVTKPRQAGITTITAAYFAVKLALAGKDSPEAVLMLANKQETSKGFLGKIRDFLVQLPRWMWGNEYVNDPEKTIFRKNTEHYIILPNDSEAIALATKRDALRSFTPTRLVMDEAAFIEDGAEAYSAAMGSLSTGGRVTLISTPNGFDELYYTIFQNAKSGKNNYKVSNLKWYEDPRYNYDLKWITPEGEMIEETEFTFESFREKEKLEYKPTSTWYENMCELFNHNEKRIAQELDVSFIGSGGNVIEDKYIDFHEKNSVEDPKYTENDGTGGEVWVWKEPEEGHQYILSSDVSRGDSEDYSTFTIIDFTNMEQVVEYQGKIYPDQLAILLDKYGRHYNAYIVVDVTGGMGVSTILKLMELDYPNLHYDNPRTRALQNKKELEKYEDNENGKIPGFSANSVRVPMIANFEFYIRTNSIRIRSIRLVSEMKTFVYKNGKPDHLKGHHDDNIMALAMALWVLENSFKKLEKLEKQNKALLQGWISGDNATQRENTHHDAIMASKTNTPIKTSDSYSGNDQRKLQAEHMWLFGYGKMR